MNIIVVLFLAFLYFIPSIIALSNKKDNAAGILALNIFLGWMFIPWVIALVWACCQDRPKDIVQVFNDNHKGTLGYVRQGDK